MPLYMVDHTTSDAAHKLRAKLRPQHIRYVIAGMKSELVFCRDDHQGTWVDEMQDQFHCRFKDWPSTSTVIVPNFDNLPTAPCSEEFLKESSMRSHQAHCNSCISLRPTPTSQNREVKTILPAIGMPEHFIDGMISVLKAKADECMELAGKYEAAATALISLASVDARKKEVEEEEAKHRQALQYFLKEGT